MRHIQSVERKDFYFGVVESDQNNIPDDDILNLEEKNDQDIVEIKDDTRHNSVPKKDQKQNAKLKRKPDKNNYPTRLHVERDPQEGENVPEIIRTEDEAKSGDINEIIEGTNKTIGRQEKIWSQIYRM